MKNKPLNIMYLHAHDAGRMVQSYGHAISTPNVQQLAERGILFRQAFSVAPSCSPSRAGLVTGRWPHCNGMFGLAHKGGWVLNDYGQHIARYLSSHGYETALAGTQHVTNPATAGLSVLGYQHLFNKEIAWRDVEPAQAAAEFLEGERDRPFFLSVGFSMPHRLGKDGRTFSERYPTEPEGIDDRYCQPMPHMPDNRITRREMANFKMGVEVLDEAFGIVLDALERSGRTEDTLVICTTDHGPGCPDMKCTLTDRGTGVMLILAGPEPFGGGKVVDALVSQIDLYPTLCDIVGIPHPEWLQGTSMIPLLSGKTKSIHKAIFTEQNYHGAYRPMRAVRTKRYKLIRRYPGEQVVGVDGGPVDAMFREYGWTEQTQPQEELHDLVFDPHESRNLIADPAYAEVTTEMQLCLDTWLSETDDPIVRDAVPKPPMKL